MTFVFDGITTKIIIGNIGKNRTQQHLFEHFSSECHSSFLDDISIIFIDKTDSKDPNKQEHHWRYTLKTMAPQWLNVEDH